MIVGVILIILGIIFAILGWGGTAKVQVEGLGGITLIISGVGGIIMIIVGVILLAIPEITVPSLILLLGP
jgi:hypothetical protein